MAGSAIRAVGMAVGYDRPVCVDISFELKQGQSLLITGHNGAGKTTLLRTLFGLLPRLEGQCELLGTGGYGATPGTLMRAGVRFLGQGERSFDNLSVQRSRDALQLLYGFQKRAIPKTADGYSSSVRVGDLSVGQRRIEALHLLMTGNPRLYLLDEPFAGVDTRHDEQLLVWLRSERQNGTSFVIVEQRFRRLLPVCELTMVLRSGKMSYLGQSAELLEEKKAPEILL